MTGAGAARALERSDELELATVGRRTGRPHRVRLWFAYDGADIWLRTDTTTDWFRNLEREPRCRINAGGVELEARREAIADDAGSLRRVVELLRAKYGADWVADWYVDHGRTVVRLRVVGAAATPSSSPRTG